MGWGGLLLLSVGLLVEVVCVDLVAAIWFDGIAIRLNRPNMGYGPLGEY